MAKNPDLEDFLALRKQVENLQRDCDRLQGAQAQTLQTLKKEFGCENMGEAEALSVKLKREEAELEKEFARKLKAFKSKWGEVIGDVT